MLNGFATYFLAFIVTISVVLADGNVITLTPDNFDKIIDGSKAALVEFYAPWCGHCKSLAPTYEELANAFAHAKDQVVIAKVDADAHRDLGSRFGVTGFPTLKWFPKGSTTPEDYKSGRDLDALAGFITEKSGAKSNIKKAETFVQVLGSNFDSIVMDKEKTVLVEFYAPWCGHCKSLAPIYEKVAQGFATEKNCIVANLDATAHQEVASRYGVSGYPTLKLFPAKDKENPIPYEDERTEDALITFLNKHCGTHRAKGGALQPEAGRISELDVMAAEFVGAANKQALLNDTKTKAAQFSSNYAKYYVKVMEKIIKDQGYVAKETARLEKMIKSASTSREKLDDFYYRKNILAAFISIDSPKVKDEL